MKFQFYKTKSLKESTFYYRYDFKKCKNIDLYKKIKKDRNQIDSAFTENTSLKNS